MLPHGGEAPDPLDPLAQRRKSRRTARIAERIREAVSEIILFELKDPRIGFVTVIEAEVTPDVKEATVLISVIGSESRQRLTLHAIEHSRGYIQRQLGRQLRTRNTPLLRFKLDDRGAKARDLEETFERIRQERLAREGRPEVDGPEAAGEEDGGEEDPRAPPIG